MKVCENGIDVPVK